MENKVIKLLLTAILAALILLLIPSWGMFLSGMGGKSVITDPVKNPITGTVNANETMSEATQSAGETGNIVKALDTEWTEVSLSMFSVPVMVKADRRNEKTRALIVQVSDGMDILCPVRCYFGQIQENDRLGYIFTAEEGSYTSNNIGLRITFPGDANLSSGSGFVPGGTPLGTIMSDGELVIYADGMDIQESSAAAWYEESVRRVTADE